MQGQTYQHLGYVTPAVLDELLTWMMHWIDTGNPYSVSLYSP